MQKILMLWCQSIIEYSDNYPKESEQHCKVSQMII